MLMRNRRGEHIMLKCSLVEDARLDSIYQLGDDMEINKLLYSQDGIAEVEKIC